jgi:SAM-dependent methyltransferase
MPLVDKFSAVLSHPSLYLAWQTLVGGIHARKVCIRNYVRPTAGLTVLDVGCGPAYTIRYFPQPLYYGFDVSQQYIEYAKSRFSANGHFICGLFDEAALATLPPVDVVLLMGLLHHLDDESAEELLALAKRALKPDGQLVTLDGCHEVSRSRLAKYFLDKDRGKYVRNQAGYENIAKRVFPQVQSTVREDFFFIPYPALVLQCRPCSAAPPKEPAGSSDVPQTV